MMPSNVGETVGIVVGGILDVCGGDEGGDGGGTIVVSIADVELPSPMLTFDSILDMFS